MDDETLVGFSSIHSMKIQSTDDVMNAMNYTEHLAESLGFLLEVQLRLCLVTEEALVNAMEYGTTEEQQFVEIKWQSTANSLVMKVKQKGNSFPLEINENINYGSRGRGLQLILSIMDEVWLTAEEGHITLCMEKNINGNLG
jgi:serine/threonine-protein kinase RsbW